MARAWMSIQDAGVPPTEFLWSPRAEQIDLLDGVTHASEPDANDFADHFSVQQSITPDCDMR